MNEMYSEWTEFSLNDLNVLRITEMYCKLSKYTDSDKFTADELNV